MPCNDCGDVSLRTSGVADEQEHQRAHAGVHVAGIREKAAQCRRLARMVTVPSLRLELEQIANEFDRGVVGHSAWKARA